MQEQKLIGRIQNGDHAGMQELICRYYDDVYRFFCYKTHNEDLSYDLTQDTFLRLIRYFNAYTEKGTFRSYLFRIAFNVYNDYYRAHRSIQEMELNEEIVSDTRGHGGSVAEKLTVELLLAQLPAYQRDALALKYLYGMKAREIAAVMNEKVPTVKSRIRQGLARLRQLSEREWIE